MKRAALGLTLTLALAASAAKAEPPAPARIPPASLASPTLIDRVVVRWHAPETGGPARPQFLFERELAFEARLESLADPDPEPGAYHDRHVRAALELHIGETLLAAMPIVPAPSPREIADRAEAARGMLEQRVRGRENLLAAAAAEGIGFDELDALLRRKARASIYLHKMVAPMLEPSELSLRDLWRTGSTPFRDQPFNQIKTALSRWYVGKHLGQATDAYFQNARARVVISVSRRAH